MSNNPIVVTFDKSLLDQAITDKRGEVRSALLGQFDKQLIQHCLNRYDYNQTKVAQVLGINRLTLRKRILSLGLMVGD